MNKFNKVTELKSYKAVDGGNGGFEGVFNEMFFVDSGADIVIGVDGLNEFVKDGFAPDTHGMTNGFGGSYTYKDMLAYPTFAEVRGYSIYGGFEFHSTQDAQDARVKMQERIAAGKSVSMSIGYSVTEEPIYVDAKDYETKLKDFIPSERLSYVMDGAKNFPFVRLIKVKLHEVSPVPIPMNMQSLVTMVKSVNGIEPPTLSQQTEDAIELLKQAVNEFDNVFNRAESIVTKRKEEIKSGVKAGRVLSRVNEAIINEATDAADEVAKRASDIAEKMRTLVNSLYDEQKSEVVFEDASSLYSEFLETSSFITELETA